ncbi:MAG TPA: hypothetical protein VNM90_17210 [Haliangium sp.]|nr:hypothetical protein [Haliangium sp.]
MKEVEVRFSSGRDVLGAYWGHLTGGGLAVEPAVLSEELREGQSVSLQVYVASKHRVAIPGTVVKKTQSKVILAFAADDGKRRLLTAAFSERCVALDARLLATDPDGMIDVRGHVFQLSDAGCCVRLPPVEQHFPLSVGTNVTISVEGLHVSGCVVAARADERWVLFDLEKDAIAGLRAYLDGPGPVIDSPSIA